MRHKEKREKVVILLSFYFYWKINSRLYKTGWSVCMLCALLCCLYCINFMSIRLMEQVSMRKWFICHLFMRCAFGSFFSWHLFFVYISNKWKRERKRKKISLICRILCVFDGIWRSRSLFFKMRGIYYVKTGVVMNFYRISIAIMYESGFFFSSNRISECFIYKSIDA